MVLSSGAVVAARLRPSLESFNWDVCACGITSELVPLVVELRLGELKGEDVAGCTEVSLDGMLALSGLAYTIEDMGCESGEVEKQDAHALRDHPGQRRHA